MIRKTYTTQQTWIAGTNVKKPPTTMISSVARFFVMDQPSRLIPTTSTNNSYMRQGVYVSDLRIGLYDSLTLTEAWLRIYCATLCSLLLITHWQLLKTWISDFASLSTTTDGSLATMTGVIFQFFCALDPVDWPWAILSRTSRSTGVDTTDFVMTRTFSRPTNTTRYGNISL